METIKKKITYGSTQTPNNRASYAQKVIAISSGKGGVGKSTVAANFAVGLAQKGLRVGLLDADIYGPSIPRLFGVENERLAWNNDNKMIPSENFGVKLMSVGLTTPQNDTPLVWRSSVAVSALIQFLEDVAWGELDYMIIDMPPGTGDVQLTMAQEIPLFGAILVTTPQMLATDDVSRAIMMFKETHVPILGLVENMSYFIAPDTNAHYDIFGSGGAKHLCENYDVPLLTQIPLTCKMCENSDEGKMAIIFGEIEIQKSYKEMIEKILKK
ncbi:MAG: Mrp/NBP35 family ATP-binding protein [Sulfurospirillaceae bacterium]|nr:Mrp/NBP35 family ATP-binding protein [Sulfurospirillaceae bacterium]